MSKAEREKQIGPAHISAFNGALRAAEKRIREADKCEKIKKFVDKYGPLGPTGSVKQVEYFRLAKTYSKTEKRLEYRFAQGSEAALLWEQVLLPDVMKAGKVRELPWMAPPGSLEMELQKFLDGFQNSDE